MKPVFFHPDAKSEMVDAAAWYETQQINLGKRFLSSIQDTINRLKLQPNLYSFVESDVRRCLTKIFPFGVMFREKRDRIEIMAVMHLHRDPNYWKNRKFERIRLDCVSGASHNLNRLLDKPGRGT